MQNIRRDCYRRLAPIAREWAGKLDIDAYYPDDLEEFLAHCHKHGQTRPTPLLLKYGLGDYNRLHQDLYGDIAFPMQVVICLSEAGRDFSGGEFVMTEQRPRVQTRVEVLNLQQGEGVVFVNSVRPDKGKRSYRRVQHRHGVSRIRSGERYSLGIIFHDAKP